MQSIAIRTTARAELIDITARIQQVIRQNQWLNGLVCLSVPHTTAAITINENADPAVPRDILEHLNKMVPLAGGYQHIEGNSAAHIKSSLVGPAITIIVANGEMVLGAWQGIFFCEFDGPRSRELYLSFAPE